MNAIFDIVYYFLILLSDITGLTYNEVNIAVYYILFPFVYIFLADKIIRKHFLKAAYILAIIATLLYIPSFTEFSDWLFLASVDFLQSLKIFGWNYVTSSVLICVIFPGIVLLVMIYFAYPRLVNSLIHRTDAAEQAGRENGRKVK